jgi:leader peptidase (prepilin peptidase)/N-methyltransferase
LELNLEYFSFVNLGYVFLLGLIIGSFLNVLIYRIPEEISIVKPPSNCPKCNTRLKVVDLIPVFSYVFLKGKCRYCGEKVSSRYMLIEILTGAVFAVLFWRFGLSPEFMAFSFLMSILIAVFFIDLDHMIIPNGLVITGLIAGGILFLFNLKYGFDFYQDTSWWNPIVGMFSSSVLLTIIALVGSIIYKSEAMGGGDLKIFLPIGIFLGWKMALIALFIAVIISGIPSMVLVIIKKANRKTTIPFGPFIVVGTFVTILFGWDILRWYLATLNIQI